MTQFRKLSTDKLRSVRTQAYKIHALECENGMLAALGLVPRPLLSFCSAVAKCLMVAYMGTRLVSILNDKLCILLYNKLYALNCPKCKDGSRSIILCKVHSSFTTLNLTWNLLIPHPSKKKVRGVWDMVQFSRLQCWIIMYDGGMFFMWICPRRLPCYYIFYVVAKCQ